MLKNSRRVGLILMTLAAGFSGNAFAESGKESLIAENTQQQTFVTGTITDATGEPVIGASVFVKGTQTGTITDLDGNFRVDAPKGATLIISFIGYTTQEIVVTGKAIKVKLAEDTKLLDEVVVVGYATVKKANLTGAVSAVDSKVLEDRPIVNLGQGLQGVIPNLNVTTSNRPGVGSTFNIRGTTALGGSSPLILVDGVEMDPNLINPADVQSISVLKDASSAAIYGARAAYGVVLITTRGGKKDQPTKVSFDATLSFNSPTTRPTYMDSMEYATWMNTAQQNTIGRDYFDAETMQHIEAYYNDPVNNQPVFVHSNPAMSSNGTMYTYCGNTNWMKELYKKSYPLQKYNMNISGGGEKVTYYTSLGYTNQGSMLNFGNESYKQFNVMNNIKYDVNNWLHFGMKTSFNRTKLNGLSQSTVHGDTFMGADTRPLMPIKHPDGNWSGQGNTNFPAVLSNGSVATNKNDLWNTISMELTPIKGMSINMDYTFNYYSEHTKMHRKEYNEYGADGIFLQVFPWTKPNAVSESQNNATYNAFNFFGDYEKTLGKHYLKGMIGFNQESKSEGKFNAGRQNLISNDLPSMNFATGEKSVGNSEDSWATRSGFFRLNYGYDERYLLEINGRYDLSSKFPKDDRAAFNPSYSAAWRISNEEWFKNWTNSFFDELKIRGSYGSLGNQALVNGWYAYLSNYSTQQSGWIMGSEQPQYVVPGGLVSQSITWETVTQWNIALDFVLLNNRLKGSFDYYQRRTSDILSAGKILPGILGANEPLENAAESLTKGWEFEASWNDQFSNGLHYTIGVNLSDYQSEVTKFDNSDKSLSQAYVGQKQGEIWGYVTEGLFQSEQEIANAANQDLVTGGLKLMPGDIHFKDLNNDGKIDWGENKVGDSGDKKVIGNSTPRYRYGANLSIDWKGVDFGIFFQGVGKRNYYMPGVSFLSPYGSEWQVPSGYNVDYWREDNKNAFFPLARFNGGSAINQAQTRYMVDASYCRLKSLSLGYTIPKTLTAKFGVDKLRIYFTGENLFTISNAPEGLDPELDNPYKYPMQRSFSIGLNLTL